MQSKARKRYHHGSLRQALIDVAVRVVAKHGIDALNLRQLAAHAGVTTGAPYHHFANRKALLSAIAEQGFLRFEADLTAERKTAHPDPGARLEALGRAYVRFAIVCPGYFRVMFHGDSSSSGATQAGMRAFQLLHDTIVDCQRGGLAPAGDPAPLVLTAWSAVHGLATLWVDAALPFEGLNPDRLTPEVGHLLVRMFAALARDQVTN
jgi:AcrR family transcriptional regulator